MNDVSLIVQCDGESGGEKTKLDGEGDGEIDWGKGELTMLS